MTDIRELDDECAIALADIYLSFPEERRSPEMIEALIDAFIAGVKFEKLKHKKAFGEDR